MWDSKHNSLFQEQKSRLDQCGYGPEITDGKTREIETLNSPTSFTTFHILLGIVQMNWDR
jgi:hypothetical protein